MSEPNAFKTFKPFNHRVSSKPPTVILPRDAGEQRKAKTFIKCARES